MNVGRIVKELMKLNKTLTKKVDVEVQKRNELKNISLAIDNIHDIMKKERDQRVRIDSKDLQEGFKDREYYTGGNTLEEELNNLEAIVGLTMKAMKDYNEYDQQMEKLVDVVNKEAAPISQKIMSENSILLRSKGPQNIVGPTLSDKWNCESEDDDLFLEDWGIETED